MIVTNGVVEYGRTVKPADYENKSAKVVLTFGIEDGADPAAAVASVFDMAMAEVHRRLGLSNGHAAPVEIPKEWKRPDAEIEAQQKAAKAVPQANPTATTPPTKPVAAAPSAPVTATVDPLAITAPETGPVSNAPVEITDKDLHAAVHQAVERKVSAMAIRDLTATFTGVVGMTMTAIAQDKRPEFLSRLKELPAA